MDKSESPFDDPEVKAAMQEVGVVHRPGLADEMLQEMAPLLAEQGIDLNDPDADFNDDQLNAALNYATERYNMELSTPVGEERFRTLTTLREISDAVSQGNTARAERIIDSVKPDATSHRPSAAQLIGTSMDLLDSWHSQDPTQSPLAKLRVPDQLGRGRSAAPDLLALARKGRAYTSMDKLMLSHGGLSLAHAGALLVASSLVALAEHEQSDFAQLADRFLPRASRSADALTDYGSQPSTAAPGSAFGPAVAATVSSQRYVKDFRTWLDAGNGMNANPDAEITIFEVLVDRTTADGIDLHEEADFNAAVALIEEDYPPHQAGRALEVLHDYVAFRMQLDEDPEGWAEAHQLLEEVLHEEDGGTSAAVMEALRAADEMSDEQRRTAVSELRLISATTSLLHWIGTSRPITPSGVPRRADIETIAAMIGVSAEGVVRLPAPSSSASLSSEFDLPVTERERVYVQSASDIPQLMAWWVALQEAGVIELTSTRVRPGPYAEMFTAEGPMSMEAVDELISAYVAEVMTQTLSAPLSFVLAAVVVTAGRIKEAIAPGTPSVELPDEANVQIVWFRSSQHLRNLEMAEVIAIVNEEPVIPAAVQRPVMAGIIMATAALESDDE